MRNLHVGLCLGLFLGAAGCTHASASSVDDWSGLGSRDGFARYGDDRPRARGVVAERRPAREFVLGNSFAQLDGGDDGESSEEESGDSEPEFFEEISREDEDEIDGGEDDGGGDDDGETASDEVDKGDEGEGGDEDPGESGEDERAGA